MISQKLRAPLELSDLPLHAGGQEKSYGVGVALQNLCALLCHEPYKVTKNRLRLQLVFAVIFYLKKWMTHLS